MERPPASRCTTIETTEDIRRGVAALARKCPDLRRVHRMTGDPPLRRHAAGFEGLARIVVSQQVSAASAAAIWQRTVLAVQPFSPQRVRALREEDLGAAGLSRPKVRTLKAVAEAIASGELDLDALSSARDDEIRAALTAIHGIGPWTADIYLMFCLGRADSWAGGDLALQLAVQSVLGLEARPDAAELEAIAVRWRPWRAVAARMLWAYHATSRGRSPPRTIERARPLPQKR